MNNPSFYAVIPASVRYDADLPANAKLLYGEITALANHRGYCFATNRYFAELYSVTTFTVSRWISLLEARGHIEKTDHERENGSIERRIGISNPLAEKVNHNNTVNNISNNTVNIKKRGGVFPNNESPSEEGKEPVPGSRPLPPKEKISAQKEKVSPSLTPVGIELPYAGAFADKWRDWLAYRRERGQPAFKPIGLVSHLKKILELSNGSEATAIAIIDQSMANGWSGIFQLKTENTTPNGKANNGNEIYRSTPYAYQFDNSPEKWKDLIARQSSGPMPF